MKKNINKCWVLYRENNRTCSNCSMNGSKLLKLIQECFIKIVQYNFVKQRVNKSTRNEILYIERNMCTIWEHDWWIWNCVTMQIAFKGPRSCCRQFYHYFSSSSFFYNTTLKIKLIQNHLVTVCLIFSLFLQRLLGGLSRDKEFLASLVNHRGLQKELTTVNVRAGVTSGSQVAAVAKEALTALQVCWSIIECFVCDGLCGEQCGTIFPVILGLFRSRADT